MCPRPKIRQPSAPPPLIEPAPVVPGGEDQAKQLKRKKLGKRRLQVSLGAGAGGGTGLGGTPT